MQTVNLLEYKEIVEAIKESGAKTQKLCFQCGLCDTTCPWNRVRDFSIRKIVRQAGFGLAEIENEEIWRCTTCGKCPQRCPRGVNQIEVGVGLRRLATQYGVFPNPVKPIKTIAAGLVAQGNPFGEDRAKRPKWTEGIDVPAFEEGMEYLYFSCCYPSYDKRLKRVANATSKILKRSGADFGILGEQESCCGESIRKAGDEELFRRLAKENIKTFIDAGVKKIIATSPHCYHAFKNDYSEFRVNFEVLHMSQYLLMMLKEGKIQIKGEYPKKVAYHDPCYLGRHNGIYDEPREILKSIPGIQLIELPDAREESLCCGGGGGRIWMETPKEERFSNLRLEQALSVGAEVLVTACPYCITNFEDSRVVLNYEDKIEIKDITEIVEEVI